MFIFIRLVLILAVCLIIFLILVLTGVLYVGKESKAQSTSKISGWAIYVGLISCFGSAVCAPLENSFITFNTLEDSLRYSAVSTDSICVRESEDCAFILSGDITVHTIDTRPGGYGVCDAHKSTRSYTRASGVADKKIFCYALTNTKAEKTLYLIFLDFHSDKDKPDEIYLNGVKAEYFGCMYPENNSIRDLLRSQLYLSESGGFPSNKLTIAINGKDYYYQ